MHFMILILAFLLGAVLWGYFHSNPRGVSRAKLLACNIAVLALGAAVGAAAGVLLLEDGLRVKPGEAGLAWFLAIMGGGTAFMIIVAAGGLVRNLVLFPLSRRSG
ncbi:MAG: hypothetical protein OEV81_16365 [Betaproteobacteria bacterium]|nr:hypothetical protein [Betaproteobacteria bacterium]MDH5222995.1 hypothetical protein [Betaproteobacteria bacterium]MDH5351772.1 hypothetical protein [Betaproteobacteria bacterium]